MLDPRRPRHALAEQLFDLAREGDVELFIAPQGHRIDADGDLAARLAALIENESIEELPQLAYVSAHTLVGESLIVGANVEGFPEDWQAATDSWRTHEGKAPGDADRWHVETHLLQQRDVFITDDQPLLAMCRRLQAEHGHTITAMTLADYLVTVTP